MNAKPLAVVTAAAFALVLVAAPSASADPVNQNTFLLDLACSDGQIYTVTVSNPDVEQPAVHLVDSTSVLVPTTFAWHVLVTDASGGVLDESTSAPEVVHGRSVDRLDTIECTFAQYAYHDWPDVGPVTIEVDGTVQAYRPH